MTQEPGDTVFAHRTEAAFHRWGRLMIRHRWPAVLLPVLVTAYLFTWLPQLTIDNSTEGFLRADDPATIRYNNFRDRFDRDDRIILALHADDIFDLGFLARLRQLHLALAEELPYVEEVTSLFNARLTRGEGDRLIVEDLLEGWLEQWPDDPAAAAGLRERVLANPLYVDTLVSRDADFTAVTIKPFTYSTLGDGRAGEDLALAGFDDDLQPGAAGAGSSPPKLSAKENDALLAAIRDVVERFETPDFPIYLGGPLAITDHLNRSMSVDMQKFLSLCIVAILGLLYFLFRRVTGAILPLAVVVLSVLASIGIMIMLDIPGTTAVQILPVFLLTVGICDAVHILAIVDQRLARGESKNDAIAYAIGHAGLAVVMTSVTTAAGMASFLSAEMAPVAHLGTVAPIGVMMALAYTLIMLPAVLSFAPMHRPKLQIGSESGHRLTDVIVGMGGFAARNPRPVLLAALLVTAISIAGAIQARFSHYALEWFDPDDPYRLASELVDRELRGSMSLEVVLDTGRENGLHDPAVLKKIEQAAEFAEGFGYGEVYIGKTLSLVDILEETHQALNENRPEFRRIPDDRALVAQELLLFENAGSDDLEEIVDTQFRQARLSLRAPFVDAMLYGPFMDELERGIRSIVGDDIHVEMTGFMPVLSRVVSAVIVSMGRSYFFALLIITPLMIFLLQNIRLGVISMLPNLLPIVFTLGLMGWLDIPLDASTIMIGAMVIGIAVDDTIHFMHKFRIYYEETSDAELAVRETLRSTGAALLFTSVVLAGGFYTLLLASMVNTRSFGLLAGSATLVAFLADVLIGPALMVVATRRSDARVEEEAVEPGIVEGAPGA